MRRRTYAIFTAAVLSTFSILMLINGRPGPPPGSTAGDGLIQASRRLCQALEASRLYLDPPARAHGPIDPSQLIKALGHLGLTPGEPPASLGQQVRAPGAKPAKGQGGAPGEPHSPARALRQIGRAHV